MAIVVNKLVESIMKMALRWTVALSMCGIPWVAQCAEAGPSITLKSLLSGTPHQGLMAIAFDGSVGVAVGVGGEIETTQDSGKRWQVAPSPSPLALLGVDVKDGLTVAVGQRGLILVRHGSPDWKKTESGTSERLFSVSVNSKGNAVAVGSFGTVIASTDRGETWQSIAPNWAALIHEQGDQFTPHVYAAHLDDAGTVTVAGELGVILRSSDAGKTWNVLHQGDSSNHKEDESLFALDIRKDGIAYAVGQDGEILRSSDGGLKWAPLNSGTKSILLGVHSSPGGEIVVTGMYSMLVSKDDGKTWNLVIDQAVASSWYAGVARPADGADIVVGKSGVIMRVAL